MIATGKQRVKEKVYGDSITFDTVGEMLQWMDASKVFKGRRVEVLWRHARGCQGGGLCDQARGCRPVLAY